jgi:hypothetical protein
MSAPLIAAPPLLLVTEPESVPLVMTVKLEPLLTCPLTVTVTGPVVAEPGTVTPIDVALQLLTAAATPLNRTTLLPWVAPKFWPVMVTPVPAAPLMGERDVIVAPGVTVKVTPLLVVPPDTIVTGPVVVPAGTGTTMLESLQLMGVAAVPLKFTTLVPCGIPNPEPAIVTTELTVPEVGVSEEMLGGGMTVKLTEFEVPPCVTITGPVVAVGGTGTTICVLLQAVELPATPLKVTVPGTDPKFVPAMVTELPTRAALGEMVLMFGAGTVNDVLLLATPVAVVTTRLPLVASAGTLALMLVLLHEVTVAVVPLNFTVPVELPKLLPLMVTGVPAVPDSGVTELTTGGGTTVNVMPLLETPFAVTTTGPVVAPAGTGTTIEVSLQLEAVAAVPLKLTVPAAMPNAVPEIVTDVPTAPAVGTKLLMFGAVAVNVTMSLAPFERSVTLCLLPTLFCKTTAASSLSVLAVATGAVTGQLNVRTAAVLSTLLIPPTWQTVVSAEPEDETRKMQTSVTLMLEFVVVLSRVTE